MEKTRKLGEEIIIALIPGILIFTIEIFFLGVNGGIIGLKSMCLSMIIGYSLYLIILSILKSTAKTTIIFSSFLISILVINQIKIQYTGEPLYFSDINFITKIGDLAEMVSVNMIFMIKTIIISILILFSIIFVTIIWTQKHDLKIVNKKIRITMAVIGLAVILILFIPNSSTKKIYLNYFFDMDEKEDYNSYTTNLGFYLNNNLISGMYGVLLNNRFEEPENYDEQKINEILSGEYEESRQKSEEKPNIIVFFSESFWDIEQLEEVKFDKEITENYRKLSKEGKKIDLISCAYGGMSENVAFELLTGGKLNYFSNGYIPIMSLYTRENSNQIISLIKELKNNEYQTKITFGKDFYNSKDACLKIGFDEYVEIENTVENNNEGMISDEYLTNLTIEALENKKKGEKLFYMVETIQNHIPYTIDKYKNYDIEIKESELDEVNNNTLLSYAQGIYESDKQLGRLYDYIKRYEEPTILIFLGDHLPYLYNEKGENVIDKLEYFNSQNELENTFRKYNTQGLILSNYEVEYEETAKYLGVDMFLNYVLNQTGIELSNYYKWLYYVAKDLPAYNKYFVVDFNGAIFNIGEMQKEQKYIYDIRKQIQFKLFISPTVKK